MLRGKKGTLPRSFSGRRAAVVAGMDLYVLLPTAGPPLAHRPANPLLSTAKATNPCPRLATKARRAVYVRDLSSPPPPSKAATLSPSLPSASPCTRWVVVMEKPPIATPSKSEVIDYHVQNLVGF